MTSTRDSTVTSGHARAGDRGIVLAGDRTATRHVMRRHTMLVRLLKAVLPVSAIGISSLYGLSVMKTIGWGTSLPTLEIPQILPENLAMQNPHYEGFNKDGGRYWVKAETAQQDLKFLNLINLNGITGELIDAKKLKTALSATRGTFDNKANLLELYDAIDVAGETGMKAHLTRATVQTKENIITSDQPVQVTMDAGTINSKQMTARQKTREYTFVDQVRAHLNAKDAADTTAAPTASPGQSAKPFGSANAPVDITANRLDVDDAKKTALFTGSVTAIQDGATLTTPELEVSYDGSATAQPPTTEPNSKLKRIVAKNPVVLKQASGETVTSRSADFDAVSQTAALEGEVVMTQLPDKRATADKADIDQSTNTVVLTGDVIVTQGTNVLKGQRLVFARATSKMQLTGQKASGGAGRIAAQFQQAQSKTASAAASTSSSQGIPFGGTFKSDPNAPVNIDANRLDVDDGAKQAVFTGDVHAVQGDFVIRAAELVASYSGSAGLNGDGAGTSKQSAAQLTHIKARTKVQVSSKDGQTATGDWADFDPKANMATMGGGVVLTQGKNVVHGTKLLINMATGECNVITEAPTASSDSAAATSNGTAISESAQSGRPSAVFYPGEMKARVAKPQPGTAASGWAAQTEPPRQP